MNSICIISVPNDFSIIQNKRLSNKFDENEYWVSYPEHLSYLNALLNLFKTYNFEALDNISTFTIDFFLFNQNTYYVKNIGKYIFKSVCEINTLLLNTDIEKYY